MGYIIWFKGWFHVYKLVLSGSLPQRVYYFLEIVDAGIAMFLIKAKLS